MFKMTSKEALERARKEVSPYPLGNVLKMAYLFKTGKLYKK